jgi:Zn-dependent protease
MSATSPAQESRPAYTVAGFLSAMAIAAALIGIVWHPLRLILPALVISLVAAGMAPKGNRLAQAGVIVAAGSFFVGMLVAVVTQRALF